MKAILLNKDDEYFFSSQQKSILLKLNGDSSPAAFLPFYPLCITLDAEYFNGNRTFPDIKKSLQKITVKSPHLIDSVLFWPVEITLNNGITLEEKIVFGKVTSNTEKTLTEELCRNIRVFRLAEIKKTGFVFEIQKPVWVKLR